MKRQFLFGTMLTAALAVSVGAQQAGQAGAAGQDPARGGQDRGGQTVTVTGCLQPANRAGSGQSTAGDTTSKPSGQSGSQTSQFILTDASTSGAGATGTGTSGTGSAAGTPTGTGATGTGTGAGTGTGTGAGTGTGTGATGTGSTASAGAQKSFRLVGGTDQNLQQYVNSRVAVTGTIQGGNRTGMGSGSTGSGTGAGTATGTGTPTGTGTGTGTGAGTGTGTGTGAGTGSTGSGSMAGSAGSAGANMPALTVTSVRQVAGSCSGGDVR